MKSSKLLLFLASVNVISIIFKILVSFIDVYKIPQGWMTGLIIDVLSVYIIATSEVKHKRVCFFIAFMAFAAIILLLATLAKFGLVQIGW